MPKRYNRVYNIEEEEAWEKGMRTGKDPCKLIGENLKILREAMGITQMEAAKRIDISVSGYREIERGNANPTLRTVELIADGLGVPALALLKEPLSPERVQITQAVILLTQAISHRSAEERKDFLAMTSRLISMFPPVEPIEYYDLLDFPMKTKEDEGEIS